jgi:hypothetical protein
MTPVLSYCTVRSFTNGFVPLVALKPKETKANNDNDPLASVLGLWL